jgi:hypothetical protein
VEEIDWKVESTTVELNEGNRFSFKFHRHGSVGEDAEFEIDDTAIITHEKTETEYLHPERMKPGWTGGDAERGQWFFRALKSGVTSITVSVLFRFDVESEHKVKFVVK